MPFLVKDQVCEALRPALLQGARRSGGRCDKVFDFFQPHREGINPQDPDMDPTRPDPDLEG